MEAIHMSMKVELDNLAEEISCLSTEQIVEFVLKVDDYAMDLGLTKALVKSLKKVIKREEG